MRNPSFRCRAAIARATSVSPTTVSVQVMNEHGFEWV